MNDEQLLRYSRHILLDEIGIEGQQRLHDAHVLVVGVGGLGSPAALYLAASGIGRLTLVDDDLVDLTNLQRQILHGTPDLGRSKVASGQDALARLNPNVDVVAIEERFEDERLTELVGAADVVLDCTDNFRTRHAVNRACVATRTALVSGAAARFDGQLATFDRRLAANADDAVPCYACLFPESDAPDETDCSTFGVFAPLTGVIGALQAAEAIKLLIGLPSLSGRLLLLDAGTMDLQSITLPADPACPVCGSGRDRVPASGTAPLQNDVATTSIIGNVVAGPI